MTQPDLTLTRTRRIDWSRILENLETAGLSMQQIADQVDAGKSTLVGYKNPDCPSEPAYWVGHSLVALWATRCGCQLADVPIRTVQLSVAAMMKTFD